MKKIAFITAGMVIGGLLVASISSTMAYMGQGRGLGFNGFNFGNMSGHIQMYGTGIHREVKNISMGVEITMTTDNPTILEHMKEMLSQSNKGASLNSGVKIDRTIIPNGMKITITSTDANTMKNIQQRATSAQSGVFGNDGQYGEGMMGGGYNRGSGNGRGFGRGSNSFQRGGCPMFDGD